VTVPYRYLVDGHWLEAARIEARDANLPTIVMLHEGLGSITHWKDFPCLVAEATGAAVFLYSRYGHGASDALKEPRSVAYGLASLCRSMCNSRTVNVRPMCGNVR